MIKLVNSRLIIDYHVQSFFTTLISRWQKRINSLSKRIRFTDNVRMKISSRSSAKRIERKGKEMFARQLGARLPWSPWLRRLWLPEPSYPIHFWASCLFYDPIISNISSIPCPKLPTVHSPTLSFCTFVHSLGSLLFPRMELGHGRRRTSRITLPIHRVRSVDWPSSLLHHIIELREKNVITLFLCSLPPSSCYQPRPQGETGMVPERCVA